jgi:hypothetical protein
MIADNSNKMLIHGLSEISAQGTRQVLMRLGFHEYDGVRMKGLKRYSEVEK